jgi:hypothetical protein
MGHPLCTCLCVYLCFYSATCNDVWSGTPCVWMQCSISSWLSKIKHGAFCCRKFWVAPNHYSNYETPFSPLESQLFNDAVETLQQLKTTFSPLEKLLVIRRTFEQMTRVSLFAICQLFYMWYNIPSWQSFDSVFHQASFFSSILVSISS